jgi:hypothetical protein
LQNTSEFLDFEQVKACSFEMRIERERPSQLPASHRQEANLIHQTYAAFCRLFQRRCTQIVNILVDPFDFKLRAILDEFQGCSDAKSASISVIVSSNT